MDVFDYSARGREVTQAQTEVTAAFDAMVDRCDGKDPRTRRWDAAVDAFRTACAGAYPEPLRQVDQGLARASEVDTSVMLDLLAADPVFYRSGYLKQKALKELKRRPLDKVEVARLQAIILRVVTNPEHRREFRDYCRAAVNVDDSKFRESLVALENSRSTKISLRAKWVLATMDRQVPDFRQANQREV